LRPAATKICYHGNVPCAIEKLREIIYSHSSTNPENLAKIGPVNFETHVIGLTGIVKINKKRNSNRTYSPQAYFQQPDGLKRLGYRTERSVEVLAAKKHG